MGKALIIGAGGVASVCVHKCCQNSDVFEEIMVEEYLLKYILKLKYQQHKSMRTMLMN